MLLCIGQLICKGNPTAFTENNNKHAKQIGGPCQSNRYCAAQHLTLESVCIFSLFLGGYGK